MSLHNNDTTTFYSAPVPEQAWDVLEKLRERFIRVNLEMRATKTNPANPDKWSYVVQSSEPIDYKVSADIRKYLIKYLQGEKQ